jgi:hypothetical protein
VKLSAAFGKPAVLALAPICADLRRWSRMVCNTFLVRFAGIPPALIFSGVP